LARALLLAPRELLGADFERAIAPGVASLLPLISERAKMALLLIILSVACFFAAAISRFRYESKYFDLLVLSGVIFMGTAIPSFEVDSSLEKLDSINGNLANIQKAVENLQRK
jgi:hypothetical protein